MHTYMCMVHRTLLRFSVSVRVEEHSYVSLEYCALASEHSLLPYRDARAAALPPASTPLV